MFDNRTTNKPLYYVGLLPYVVIQVVQNQLKAHQKMEIISVPWVTLRLISSTRSNRKKKTIHRFYICLQFYFQRGQYKQRAEESWTTNLRKDQVNRSRQRAFKGLNMKVSTSIIFVAFIAVACKEYDFKTYLFCSVYVDVLFLFIFSWILCLNSLKFHGMSRFKLIGSRNMLHLNICYF